ncbi:hypothetical protein EJ05DRAFT_481212, partial [Pseudovirgaria hyperparasitica]
MRWRYIEIQNSPVENGISSIGMPGWEAGLEREDLLLIPGSAVAGTYWAIGVLVTKTLLPVPLFVKPLTPA